MKRRTLLGCLIAAALPSALCAQEAESDSLHTNLQEVEIMSIRATKTTPVAYTNIGREELNKGNTGVLRHRHCLRPNRRQWEHFSPERPANPELYRICRRNVPPLFAADCLLRQAAEIREPPAKSRFPDSTPRSNSRRDEAKRENSLTDHAVHPAVWQLL